MYHMNTDLVYPDTVLRVIEITSIPKPYDLNSQWVRRILSCVLPFALFTLPAPVTNTSFPFHLLLLFGVWRILHEVIFFGAKSTPHLTPGTQSFREKVEHIWAFSFLVNWLTYIAYVSTDLSLPWTWLCTGVSALTVLAIASAQEHIDTTVQTLVSLYEDHLTIDRYALNFHTPYQSWHTHHSGTASDTSRLYESIRINYSDLTDKSVTYRSTAQQLVIMAPYEKTVRSNVGDPAPTTRRHHKWANKIRCAERTQWRALISELKRSLPVHVTKTP